jgi:hypothetical protein
MRWMIHDNSDWSLAEAFREIVDPGLSAEQLLVLMLTAEAILDDLREDCLESSEEAEDIHRLLDEASSTWRSAKMRGQTEDVISSLRPHHDRSATEEVLFDVTRLLRDATIRCFLEAHRVDRPGRGRRVVLAAPRWAWAVLAELLDEVGYPAGKHLGTPVPHPGPEHLETALALWDPGDPESPYRRLRDAVNAARRL